MATDPSWTFKDPATLVLTGYQRMNGGTVRGDRAVAARFRSLIFPI
jgi:hypothetical protein